VSSTPGVPRHASAVLAHVAVVTPTAGTHLTLWPSGSARPGTSDVNTPAGTTRANLVLVPLGPDGRFDARTSSGQAHVVVDVIGYLDGP